MAVRKLFGDLFEEVDRAQAPAPEAQDIADVHRRRYADFFQWERRDGQPPTDTGLHKVLKEVFPVELRGGDLVISYNGYRVEETGRDRDFCRVNHLTHGVRLYLNLALGPADKVDHGERQTFGDRPYPVENLAVGLDVVPTMTPEGTFLIQPRRRTAPPAERCPVCTIGLWDARLKDPAKKYSLANMRLHFLDDYLEREIRRALIRVIRRFNPWVDKRKSVSEPVVAARQLCTAVSRAIHRCLTDERVCPVLADANPLARASQQDQVSHVGPFGLGGKRSKEWRRHLHLSHFSRLCPLETPESEGIGLTLHLARGAVVDSKENSLRARYRDARQQVDSSLTVAEEQDKKIGCFQDRETQGGHVALVPGAADSAPLLERGAAGDDTLWELLPGQFLGRAAARIPFIQHNDPTRATMGAKNMKQMVRLSKGESPLVRTGEEGGLDGDSQPGINLLVGYLPWFGYNYEDGIVISDKAAKRMKSVKTHAPVVIPVLGNERPYYHDGSKPRGRLTKEGIVYEGAEVGGGDVVARIHETSPFMGEDVVTARYREVRLPRYVRGKVTEAMYHPFPGRRNSSGRSIRGVIRIVVEEERPLAVGDKLMGRHGNKGVVARILPEREMPYFRDSQGTADRKGSDDSHGEKRKHTHLEVLLNPLGVISRMNLGQLVETHVGMVLWRGEGKKKTSFDRDWEPFAPVDFTELGKALESTGIVNEHGKAELYFHDAGENKKIEKPVVVGKQYILKLNHMAADKQHARTEGGRATVTGQPLKGRRQGGGMRLGEMEVWALQAHGADRVLRELLIDKADGQGPGALPRSSAALVHYLRGMGIDFKVDGKKLSISLADDDTVKNWSSGEVSSTELPKISKGNTRSGLVKYEFKASKTGLFSPGIFGKDEIRSFFRTRQSRRSKTSRDSLRMGHVELALPIIHPMYLYAFSSGTSEESETSIVWKLLRPAQPRKILRGRNRGDWREDKRNRKKLLVVESRYQNTCPGKVVTVQEYCDLHGSISAMDLRELCLSLEKGNAPIDLSDQDRALIEKANGFLIHRLPVLPVTLRPYRHDSVNQRLDFSDLNHLYVAVLRANARLKTALKKALPHHLIHRFLEDLEIAVNKLLFLGESGGEGRREYRSIAHLLNGKTGLVRKALLGKRCDYSARAVIVPDPALEMDRVGVPEEIWTRLYPESAAQNEEIDEGKMVILTRAPSLHKYSVQAFRPQKNTNGEQVFRINPAICSPFNADFDGDQLSFFVLHDREAIKEAEEKLLPQKNQISVSNGRLLTSMNLDIRLGIHFLQAQLEVWRQKLGEIFDNSVPADFTDFTDRLRETFQKDPDHGRKQAEELLRLAFRAATLSGCSFGMYDLRELLPAEEVRQREAETFAKNGKIQEYEDALDRLLGIGPNAGNSGTLRTHTENPVAVIYFSGAKGDKRQMRQLIASKGVLSYPLAQRNFPPVTGNYCEGLHPLEYFLSVFQSRSAVMDKKLKTAPSGYLTRRMVMALYDVVIREADCGSKEGFRVEILKNSSPEDYRWLLGRTFINNNGRGERISERRSLEGYCRQGATLTLRSPLGCSSYQRGGGICPACYGRDLQTGKEPAAGLRVGIIAAQSIGERLTQLAMRSYHTGTADSLTSDFDWIEKAFDGSSDELAEVGAIPGLLAKFRNQVDSIHFEVLVGAIRRSPREPVSVSRLARDAARGFFATAAFQAFTKTIASAAREKCGHERLGLLDRMVTGGDGDV